MMLDKQEQRVVDDIGRCGWHLLGVLAGENDPPFTDSIDEPGCHPGAVNLQLLL
jgi:hypothetical protein